MTTEDLKISKEARVYDKRSVLLTSWAAVVTMLFISTLVVGAVYISHIQSECDNENGTNQDAYKDVRVNMKHDGKDYEETIHENTEKHTDFIIKKTSEGDIELLAGINYNSKVSCVYLPKDNICVLSTGEDMAWYEDTPRNSTIEVQEKDLSDMYIINMDSKLRDTSLLTSEMKLFCHENNMYWADKAAQEGKKKNEVGNRNKRGGCIECRFISYSCRKCLLGICWNTYCLRTQCKYC